jgi:hypothetical protein
MLASAVPLPAPAAARRRGAFHARAVVLDGQQQRTALEPRRDADRAARELRLDAVHDRVLDQRLQAERRHRPDAQRGGHLDRVVEALLHAAS